MSVPEEDPEDELDPDDEPDEELEPDDEPEEDEVDPDDEPEEDADPEDDPESSEDPEDDPVPPPLEELLHAPVMPAAAVPMPTTTMTWKSFFVAFKASPS